MNIVILDGFTTTQHDLTWQKLEKLGNLTVYPRTKAEETISRAQDADIVLTNKVVIGRKEMGQLPKLKYIGVLATGYNVVDITAAKERGIIVTNVPAYSTDSVAQMVFAHLLNATNRVDNYANENRFFSVKDDGSIIYGKGNNEYGGRWSQSEDFSYTIWPITELSGKTFGIIGLGKIGMRVAEIALAFGMKVKAVTSKSKEELPKEIEKAELHELLMNSDIVSLHCPLTEQTRNLINAKTIRLMKRTAILINTGRGPLIDEQAVAEELHNGNLAAFCADVLSEEPPPEDNPVLHELNAYITPHIAWASTEARKRLLNIAIANVRAFIHGEPQNVVSK